MLDVFVLVLEQSTKPTTLSLLLLIKIYLRNCQVYLNTHYVFKAFTTPHASGVSFQNIY